MTFETMLLLAFGLVLVLGICWATQYNRKRSSRSVPVDDCDPGFLAGSDTSTEVRRTHYSNRCEDTTTEYCQIETNTDFGGGGDGGTD